MKREFLKELDLDKDTIDLIMAEHGKDINELKESKTSLEAQLTESAATIAELEGKVKDFEDLTKAKETLEKDKETLTSDLDKLKADFGSFKMRTAVEKEAASLGARNSADILNFVDFSSIKEAENGYEGIKEAVEGVKEVKPYLFEDPSRMAGGLPHNSGTPDIGDDAALREAIGLK